MATNTSRNIKITTQLTLKLSLARLLMFYFGRQKYMSIYYSEDSSAGQRSSEEITRVQSHRHKNQRQLKSAAATEKRRRRHSEGGEM